MKLNILPISQRDPKWTSKKLGTSTVSTIGGYGCLLVCHSMALKYFGHEDMDPLTLNTKYKDSNVFELGSMINYFAAGTVFQDFRATGYLNYYDVPADLSKIDEMLDKRMPVIVGVGATPTEPKKLEYDNVIDHFVLVIGKDNGEYLINDPWEGETYFFSAKYGDPKDYVFGLRLYEGPVKEEEDENIISDLETKVRTLTEELARIRLELNSERDARRDAELDNKDISGQLVKARVENSQIVGEKENLERKIEPLEKGISSLEEERTALRADLRACKDTSVEALTAGELFGKWIKRLLGR